MAKNTVTENGLKNSSAGGAMIGKRQGQTIVHNDGSFGGYLGGKLHSEGGIKAKVKGSGQPLEMQGGEVVITAPAVDDNKKRMFEGKMMTNRQILSKINEDGGGVSFADGGDVPGKIKFCSKRSYSYGGKTMKATEVVEASGCGCKHSMASGGTISDTTVYELDKAKKELAAGEKLQDVMKKANSIIKAGKDVTKRLLELGLSESEATKRQAKDFAGRVGYPSYALTNNNQNNNRLKDRILLLEQKIAASQKAAETGEAEKYEFDKEPGGYIEVNYGDDRVQIFFNDRPQGEMYTSLKRNGWHWSPTNKAWQRKITPQAISNAVYITGAKKVGGATSEPTQPARDYTMADIEARNFTYVSVHFYGTMGKEYTGLNSVHLVYFSILPNEVKEAVKKYITDNIQLEHPEKLSVNTYVRTYINESKALFNAGKYLPNKNADPALILYPVFTQVKNFNALQKDVVENPEKFESEKPAEQSEPKFGENQPSVKKSEPGEPISGENTPKKDFSTGPVKLTDMLKMSQERKFKNMGDYRKMIEDETGKDLLTFTEDEIIEKLNKLKVDDLVGSGSKKNRVEKAAQMMIYHAAKNVPDKDLTLEQYAIKKFIGGAYTEACMFSQPLVVFTESYRNEWEIQKGIPITTLEEFKKKFPYIGTWYERENVPGYKLDVRMPGKETIETHTFYSRKPDKEAAYADIYEAYLNRMGKTASEKNAGQSEPISGENAEKQKTRRELIDTIHELDLAVPFEDNGKQRLMRKLVFSKAMVDQSRAVTDLGVKEAMIDLPNGGLAAIISYPPEMDDEVQKQYRAVVNIKTTIPFEPNKKETETIPSLFWYGQKWDVPNQYPSTLMTLLRSKGFKISTERKTNIDITKDGKTMNVNDNGGELNLGIPTTTGDKWIHVSNMPYSNSFGKVSPAVLANRIEYDFNEYFSDKVDKEFSDQINNPDSWYERHDDEVSKRMVTHIKDYIAKNEESIDETYDAEKGRQLMFVWAANENAIKERFGFIKSEINGENGDLYLSFKNGHGYLNLMRNAAWHNYNEPVLNQLKEIRLYLLNLAKNYVYTLTAAQQKALFKFYLQPDSYALVPEDYFNEHLKDLEQKTLLYKTANPATAPNVEIRMTENGKKFIKTYQFDVANQFTGTLAIPVKKAEAVATEGYTFFKGVTYSYKNPYDLNKAIEEFLDKKDPVTITPEEKAW
jgi:DNA-binding MarR family transcriptional regulator